MLNLRTLTDKEVDDRIWEMKKKFQDELFIPVHHYQRDEIVQFADYTGDSLELSRVSAGTQAKYILFCGVYFMAEIARTLAAEDKHVFIPNRSAGCPLADLAFYEDVDFVWEILQENNPGEFIPVTYANSHADVKAFCGRNGGLVCTSSNVQKIFQWILDRNKRVFFMPDKKHENNTVNPGTIQNARWVAFQNYNPYYPLPAQTVPVYPYNSNPGNSFGFSRESSAVIEFW